MISNNIRSEKLEQYHYHRSRLIGLCDKAQAPLVQAQKIQERRTPYGTPADKLRADSYTLVLIGAFQSGKSTLFNYLCDGRELSPIGPNGGGLRTSGCMVTARPISDGDEERAVITWRKPDELLAALGTTLIKYYENPTSPTALTAKEVDLDNDDARARLASYAIEELTKPDTSLSIEEKELLRFTLVVCRFYKQFAEKCKAGTSTCTPEESVVLTSYPQDWENKWWRTLEQDSWKNLPEFTEAEVNFAFCGGVELFIDSAVLRDIGCSVIDCPGLFISKWDTEIATRCIKEANAILYMFAGNKSLTQDDILALQECVHMGGSHKMIFGANLRVELAQWKRILDNGILPTLKQNGFDNPVVHNFHSAIALRSRELLYQEYGQLPKSSEAAIKYAIALEGEPLSVEEFLSQELHNFICTLTKHRQAFNDFKGQYAELEKFSGVPDFVGAASNHVVETRATSVLVHEGTRQLSATLKQASAEMEQQIQLLDSGVDNALAELTSQQKALEKFTVSRELHEGSLADALSMAETAIYEHYRGKIHEAVQNKREALVRITKDIMPATYELIWKNKNALIQLYTLRVGRVLRSILEEVRKEILRNFQALPAVCALSESFEGHRREVMEKLEGFKTIENVAGIQLQFPKDFSNSVRAMVLPQATQVMIDVVDEQDGLWQWIWTILTFGMKDFYVTSNARAEAIVDEFIGNFKDKAFAHLQQCMEQEAPAGPVKVLQNTLSEFRSCFRNAETQILETIDSARSILNDERSKAEIIPGLKALIDETNSLQSECQQMESDIRKDFPSHNS